MNHTTKRAAVRGFTLIELMVVVAVIGILAAIAYQSYTEAVLKGRRAQARTALLELMQQQERYMTQRNAYLAFSTNVASGATTPAGASSTFKVHSGDNSSAPAYWLSADKCGSQPITDCVLLTATPTGTDAAAGSLTLSSTGAKGCTGTAASTNFRVCWP
ncbi:type IV pilin protein [Variovorax sp. 350MFTsu5.1]|uniref:type IV pilin protein n=1 Tax=Variovorax sp. 350MFTsu5.1 TaxID=3158365 RepID=UPI003AB07D3C